MNAIIVDDHPLARIAIRNLLDTNGIAVTTELDSGDQVVQTVEKTKEGANKSPNAKKRLCK